jgi:hypothetical protein
MATTDENRSTSTAEDAELGSLGTLMRRILGNAKALAEDQLELVRTEMTRRIKASVIDTAMVVLGGMIVFVAIGFLGGALAAGLAPLVDALWLRFIIVAAAYALVSGGLLAFYGTRLKRHLPPDIPIAAHEATETVDMVKAVGDEVRHA